jgi:hypothetical protein
MKLFITLIFFIVFSLPLVAQTGHKGGQDLMNFSSSPAMAPPKHNTLGFSCPAAMEDILRNTEQMEKIKIKEGDKDLQALHKEHDEVMAEYVIIQGLQELIKDYDAMAEALNNETKVAEFKNLLSTVKGFETSAVRLVAMDTYLQSLTQRQELKEKGLLTALSNLAKDNQEYQKFIRSEKVSKDLKKLIEAFNNMRAIAHPEDLNDKEAQAHLKDYKKALENALYDGKNNQIFNNLIASVDLQKKIEEADQELQKKTELSKADLQNKSVLEVAGALEAFKKTLGNPKPSYFDQEILDLLYKHFSLGDPAKKNLDLQNIISMKLAQHNFKYSAYIKQGKEKTLATILEMHYKGPDGGLSYSERAVAASIASHCHKKNPLLDPQCLEQLKILRNPNSDDETRQFPIDAQNLATIGVNMSKELERINKQIAEAEKNPQYQNLQAANEKLTGWIASSGCRDYSTGQNCADTGVAGAQKFATKGQSIIAELPDAPPVIFNEKTCEQLPKEDRDMYKTTCGTFHGDQRLMAPYKMTVFNRGIVDVKDPVSGKKTWNIKRKSYATMGVNALTDVMYGQDEHGWMVTFQTAGQAKYQTDYLKQMGIYEKERQYYWTQYQDFASSYYPYGYQPFWNYPFQSGNENLFYNYSNSSSGISTWV